MFQLIREKEKQEEEGEREEDEKKKEEGEEKREGGDKDDTRVPVLVKKVLGLTV